MVGVKDPNFDDIINQSENQMQSRKWFDKTQGREEARFMAKPPSLIPFATSAHEFVVDDWPGEAFGNLGNPKKYELDPNLKPTFEEAIKTSDSYVIFLDGEKLKNTDVESDVQKSLSALQRLLQDPSLPQSGDPLSKRRFAFVVTKADILENLVEFTHKSEDGTHKPGGRLDIAKLEQLVTSKYATFFNFLDWHKLEYRIFAVSCVPLKEHRKVDPKNGTMPTEDWSLKDMESVLVHVDEAPLLQKARQMKALQQTLLKRQIDEWQKAERQRHDQLAPFRWLFRYHGD